MQPKLKSKVRTADRDIGEVTRVIVDPITHDVSHIVVGGNGAGTLERQIPMTEVQVVSDDLIQFRGRHAVLLQLLKGTARLNCLMLPDITN